MPIDPVTGQPLPYGPDPAMAGAPPPDPMAGMAPDPAMAAPSFPSLDPGQMAAIAMQIIAQMAGVDQQKVQALLAQQAEQFAMQQEEALMAAPDAIAAIIAQLAAPPPETLDDAAGLMPAPQQGMGVPPEEEMAMMMGAMG